MGVPTADGPATGGSATASSAVPLADMSEIGDKLDNIVEAIQGGGEGDSDANADTMAAKLSKAISAIKPTSAGAGVGVMLGTPKVEIAGLTLPAKKQFEDIQNLAARKAAVSSNRADIRNAEKLSQTISRLPDKINAEEMRGQAEQVRRKTCNTPYNQLKLKKASALQKLQHMFTLFTHKRLRSLL